MTRNRWLLTLTVVVTLALTGCWSAPIPESSDPPTTTTDETTEQTPAVEIPDTPVGRQAKWVLDTLEADSGPTAEEAEQRFAQVFLDQVPADRVGAVFDQLRGLGPFTMTGWDGTETAGVAALTTADGNFEMQISVDAAGLIEGLLLTPSEPTPTVSSPAEASQALADQAQHSSFLLADGTCSPIEARDADTPLPIGSMFKLYVLGAVVTAVENGSATWDDELTVTDEVKSLPSGRLQDEPSGTTVTVREAADLMLSISDNTATDLLIAHVGRDAVEAEVDAMGHHEPELMKPFLTTREMFQLAGSTPDLREKWRAAVPSATDASPAVSAAQREIVDTLPAWDLTLDEALFATPFWPEGLDWFATADDLCRAHLNLQERASTRAGEPIRAILSINPGVQVPDADYVGFKGGSSVGEIGLSFYVERGGESRVLVMQTAADSVQGIPPDAWLADVAEQVLALD